MDFYTTPSYLEFEFELAKNIKSQVNYLIVTVPGMGASYYVKLFLEKRSQKEVSYINTAGQKLSEYNILDLDFDKNERALEETIGYFKVASVVQKFAVLVNTPYLLESEEYRRSFVASHVYQTYYFRARTREEVAVIVKDIDKSLDKGQTERIYALSGGIPRLVKFLVYHKDLLEKKTAEIASEPDLTAVMVPTARVVEKCKEVDLIKLGVRSNNSWISELLGNYFAHMPIARFDIGISQDLRLSEEGKETGNLSKFEAEVLKLMLDNSGFVTKEQVAEVKWGKDSYDEFSDQAVNKAMRRLDEKLTKYRIKAIPKHGFRMEKD